MAKSKIKHPGYSSKKVQAVILLIPFAIFFFVFTILPVVTSIFLSFFSFDMINPIKFVGFDNYIRMVTSDEIFPITFRNTLIFAIITGPLGFLLSFVLAWFINEFKPFSRTLLSFMFYAPSLVGNGIFIWQVAFSSDSYGYVNSLLLSMGFITEPILWLKDAKYIFGIIVMVQLWQSMGISFLSNIAGLQNVNEELYEVGAIDGIRNRWQELWYVTLPTMKSMLVFSAVMCIQSSFSAGAICAQLAGYPSVDFSADMMVQYMSDVGTTKYEMGYASAIAVVLFLMMVVARNVFLKVLNKTGK